MAKNITDISKRLTPAAPATAAEARAMAMAITTERAGLAAHLGDLLRRERLLQADGAVADLVAVAAEIASIPVKAGRLQTRQISLLSLATRLEVDEQRQQVSDLNADLEQALDASRSASPWWLSFGIDCAKKEIRDRIARLSSGADRQQFFLEREGEWDIDLDAPNTHATNQGELTRRSWGDAVDVARKTGVYDCDGTRTVL